MVIQRLHKETIEATRTKQINKIEHERHKKIKHYQCELQGLVASTNLNSMLKVFKMWEKMKVFPMLCFTKLFIVTLCKILCYGFLSCDFLSYMFCQNAKFNLWLFVLWLFVRDFLSVTFCLWLFVMWVSVLHSVKRVCFLLNFTQGVKT